jgi:hypothetical protein
MLKVILCLCFLFVVVIYGRSEGNDKMINTIQKISTVTKSPDAQLTDLTTSSIMYPNEMFFGDTVYHQFARKNETKKPIYIYPADTPISDLGHFVSTRLFTVSVDWMVERYVCVPDVYRHRNKSVSYASANIQPNEELTTANQFELPSLESAFNHPFWQKVLDKLKSQDVVCTVTFSSSDCVHNTGEVNPKSREQKKYSHKLLIKLRPTKEQQLFEKWFKDTPQKFLPPVFSGEIPNMHWWYSDNEVFAVTGYRKSGGNFVEVAGKKYSPWNFIRDGNRKPPAQICPRDIAGWIKLEKDLQPSTMRDEIKLTRMLLKYFDQNNNKDLQKNKRNEIVTWIKSLPAPQQMCMASSIHDISTAGSHDNTDIDSADSLHESYQELLKDLIPLMSHYHKEYFEQSIKTQNSPTKN